MFSPSTIAKGQKLLDQENGLTPNYDDASANTPLSWRAAKSSGNGYYTVRHMSQGPNYDDVFTCTCPNGAHNGVANCYHAAAAYLQMVVDGLINEWE